MTSGQGTETLTARMHKRLHRARIGVRKAGVDYFRGEGSDRFALAALLIAIPAIAAGTLWWPEWIAPTALVLPVIAGGLLLRPANLLVLYGASATALVVESALFGPYDEGPERITPGTVLVVAAVGLFGLLIAQFRSRVGVPWRRGGTMLFDLRERIRVRASCPSCRRAGTTRWRCARPADSPSPATSWWPPAPTAAPSSKWC